MKILNNYIFAFILSTLLTDCSTNNITMMDSIPNHTFSEWEWQQEFGCLVPNNWKLPGNDKRVSGFLRYPNEDGKGYHLYLSQSGELITNIKLSKQPTTLEVFLKSFLDGDKSKVIVNLYNNKEFISNTVWALEEDVKDYTKFEIPIEPSQEVCTNAEIILIGPKLVRSEETGVHIKSLRFN